jgi:hypothetical protein
MKTASQDSTKLSIFQKLQNLFIENSVEKNLDSVIEEFDARLCKVSFEWIGEMPHCNLNFPEHGNYLLDLDSNFDVLEDWNLGFTLTDADCRVFRLEAWKMNPFYVQQSYLAKGHQVIDGVLPTLMFDDCSVHSESPFDCPFCHYEGEKLVLACKNHLKDSFNQQVYSPINSDFEEPYFPDFDLPDLNEHHSQVLVESVTTETSNDQLDQTPIDFDDPVNDCNLCLKRDVLSVSCINHCLDCRLPDHICKLHNANYIENCFNCYTDLNGRFIPCPVHCNIVDSGGRIPDVDECTICYMDNDVFTPCVLHCPDCDTLNAVYCLNHDPARYGIFIAKESDPLENTPHVKNHGFTYDILMKEHDKSSCSNSSSKLGMKRDRMSYSDYSDISNARKKKKLAKKKAGLVWKTKTRSVLEEGFNVMEDQKIGEKIAQKDLAIERVDNLREPDLYSDYYDNHYKEREFLLLKQKEATENFKKNEYARNELQLNRELINLMNDWVMTDSFSLSRVSTLTDKLDSIEAFILKSGADSVDTMRVIDTLAVHINQKPGLIDKCSNFLRDLIQKLKPITSVIDEVRDIVADSAEMLLNDTHVVTFGKAIPLAEVERINEKYMSIDVRDDHARRGDLVHRDPLLRHFTLVNEVRKGLITTSTSIDAVLSCELLFQLLSPSVCLITSPEETVIAKMQHMISNICTINIPKFGVFEFGGDIYWNTFYAARAIYLTQRRVATALGFQVASV